MNLTLATQSAAMLLAARRKRAAAGDDASAEAGVNASAFKKMKDGVGQTQHAATSPLAGLNKQPKPAGTAGYNRVGGHHQNASANVARTGVPAPHQRRLMPQPSRTAEYRLSFWRPWVPCRTHPGRFAKQKTVSRMLLKDRVVLLAMFGLGLFAGGAQAALVGSPLTGSFRISPSTTNYFDPSVGGVPAGFLNTSGKTVVIREPAVEFGYNSGSDLVSANLTDSQLLIEDQSLIAGATTAYQVSFTDSAFAGLAVTTVANTFPGAPVVALSGTTLTVSYVPQPLAANTLYLSLFNIAPAVPEPTSLALIGGLGTAGLARRRRTV